MDRVWRYVDFPGTCSLGSHECGGGEMVRSNGEGGIECLDCVTNQENESLNYTEGEHAV